MIFDAVTVREVAARGLTLEGGLLHALGDDAGEAAGIGLCHCLVDALQYQTLVAGADALLC